MLIEKVKIQNFLSFRDQEFIINNHNFSLILGNNEDSSSADSNGAGKSAIFEAICWCLFGKTVRGAEYDEVINNIIKKDCKVIVDLQENSTEYKIIRTRKTREGNVLLVFQNNEEISKPTISETEKLIEQIIGMNYQIFVNSIIFPQGAVQFFASLTDREQKEILEKILGLEDLSIYQNAAKRQVNVIENECLKLLNRIEVLEEQIEELKKRLSDLKKDEQGWDKEQNLKIAKKKKEIDDLKKAIENSSDESMKIHRNLHVLERKLKSKEEIRSQIEQLKDLVIEKEKDLSALETKYAALDNEQSKLKNNIYKVETLKKQTNCPLCGQPLSPTQINKHVNEIKKELDKVRSELADIDVLIGASKVQLSKLKEGLRIKENKLSEFERLETSFVNYKYKLKEVKYYQQNCQKEITKLKKEIEQIEQQGNPYGHLIKQSEEQLKKKEMEVLELNQKYEELSEDLQYYKFWVEGFSNRGLKSFILDSVIPYMNEKVNYYSRVLTDGAIQINFHTQTKLKSGQMREKFGVEINCEGGGGHYNNLSSGEKRKVDLAILMTLRDLVKNRATKEFNILFCDEIFDTLDESGIERAIELLRLEAQNGCKIFVISHDEGMKEYFNDVVLVKKVDGRSVIYENKN